MSLKDCIDEAVAGGEMDPERAAAAKRLFDEVEADYLDAMGPDGAAIKAAQETHERLTAEALEKRRQTLIAIRTQRRIMADLAGTADKRTAVVGLVDGVGLSVRSPSAEQIRKRVLGTAHGLFEGALSRFRRDIAGRTREKGTLANVVREAFGEKTGDQAAKELAQAWHATADYLRNRRNAAGGHTARLDGWGLPQAHDPVKIREASYEAWRDFVRPMIDLKRMTDGATGKPFTSEGLELALRAAHETARTDGWVKIKPSLAGGGKSLANQRADHRWLHFKSADDWIAYQERFGNADPFNTMVGHIAHMARDIGAMEALGPNPPATIRWLQQAIEKEAATSAGDARTIGAREDAARKAGYELETLYMHYAGQLQAPVNAPVGRFFQGTRQFLTSVQLGSAAISALSDVNFIRMTAAHAGLDQARVLKRYVKLLAPGSMEDQKVAVRLGLIAENWSQVASSQMRYVGEVVGPESIQRLSDAVLRASYLSHMTQSGRWAFGMEFMGTLADYAGKAFDELPKPLRNTLERYRIGADGWDIARQSPLYTHEGASFLRPDDVAARRDISPRLADDIATRMLTMIQSETEFAVPSVSLRGKAAFSDRTRPGTIAGEVIRSGLMYKNFAITLYFTHIRRMVEQKGPLSKGGYAANLIIGATLMGALAMQMKEISKGRDPRPMFGEDKSAFWMAAALQGGGLGIFGDFLFSDANRFGGSLPQTVAGPVVAFADDTQRLTLGNLQELIKGKNTNAGRDLARYLKRYTPGGSIWYARLALERMIFDQLEMALDPKARTLFGRAERRQAREFGNQYFWRRGERAPDRAPDLGSAFGRSEP